MEINYDLNPFTSSIEPIVEIAAYESLWNRDKTNFKKLSRIFEENPNRRPSDLVKRDELNESLEVLQSKVFSGRNSLFPKLLIKGTFDYPSKLGDAQDPVYVLYYRGNYSYLNSKSVAVVGTRNPSEEGLRRTAKLVKHLVEDKITVVSGLAKGVDTMAHKTAIANKGRTIAVIGTPINQSYPKENKDLQDEIAKDHLLISQVPFLKYHSQDYRWNRQFFPERNKTMSALTEATIIVEASETSGTLIQAKAALHQKRKLFILDSCFHNKMITWPEKFEKLGAIRVREYEDISNALTIPNVSEVN